MRWGDDDPHMVLVLGTWETTLGRTLSHREQECVYRALQKALGQGVAAPVAPQGQAAGGLAPHAKRAAPPPKNISWDRGADGSVRVVVGRGGFGGPAVMLFFAAVFWDVIVAVLSGVYVQSLIEGHASWSMILFFAPFWVLGVALPAWACWSAWGITEVRLDRSGVTLTKQLFGLLAVHQYEAARVEAFTKRVISIYDNGVRAYVCRLSAGGKGVNFGHYLDEDDQEWLIDHLNRAAAELGLGC